METLTGQLRELKGLVNLMEPRSRYAFFTVVNMLIRSWNGPLPKLLDVYTAEEIEIILKLAAEGPVGREQDRLEFVEFVAATGYRDAPRAVGPAARHRVTALHRLFYSQANADWNRMARALFRIYDQFHANYVDDSPGDPTAMSVSHLHVACCVGGGLDIVQRFLDSGQDANVATANGVTPLHLALTLRDRGLVELLLRRGAQPRIELSRGFTLSALHHLCWCCADDHEMARMFLDVCAEIGRPLSIDARDHAGDTPLHVALTHGCSEGLLRLLLERGADPNAANGAGSRPLHVICQKPYVQGLLETFFNLVGQNGRVVFIDAQDSMGWTPLHSALRSGNDRAAAFLLQNRANPDSADKDGWTPRHLIHERRDESAKVYLLGALQRVPDWGIIANGQ